MAVKKTSNWSVKKIGWSVKIAPEGPNEADSSGVKEAVLAKPFPNFSIDRS